MWNEEYQWHFDYARLARDAGFGFDKCKFVQSDRSSIGLIDIERIIKDRDIAVIEKHIPQIIQYVLDKDQAEVLDSNFVKTFRLSQLTVDYLLFCKKYLDNTIVLLKKEVASLKEENEEQKRVIEELESHINILSKSLKEQTVSNSCFKCNMCYKAFSTQDYLNAHMKRRHLQNDQSTVESEREQLKLEIKELKEKLNSSERNTQNQQNNDSVKLTEIQENFDRFKQQIENEIKLLQMQKSFYDDKYGKLINVIANQSPQFSPRAVQTIPKVDRVEKVESTTQTEKDSKLDNVRKEDQNNEETVKKVKKNDEEKESDTKYEEYINNQMSEGLRKIETQLEAFWEKLNIIEQTSKSPKHNEEGVSVVKKELEVNLENIEAEDASNIPEEREEEVYAVKKPKVKPRLTLKQKSMELDKEQKENREGLVYKSPSKPKQKLRTRSKPPVKENFEESSSSEKEQVIRNKLQPVSPLKRRRVHNKENRTSPKKAENELRDVIEKSINARLESLGINASWKGIPQETFLKTMEIVNHQAQLVKKKHPSFGSIRDSIENSLRDKNTVMDYKNVNISSSKVPELQKSVFNVNYREKENSQESGKEELKHTVEIKNRHLYDTDSDNNFEALGTSQKQISNYSEVIQEFKELTTRNEGQDKMNSSEENLDRLKLEKQMKGVLKNFPSVGSLTKKKVIFDIESNHDKEMIKGDGVLEKGTGSTTSIASSVLDGSQHKVEKDVESISDFDLSEL